jgi:hypothetical protein
MSGPEYVALIQLINKEHKLAKISIFEINDIINHTQLHISLFPENFYNIPISNLF